MKVLAYYHIFCLNHWREIITGHCRVLSEAGFTHPINVSFIGNEDCWQEALEIAQAFGIQFVLRARSENPRDFEAPAMRLIEADCAALGNEHASVMYFHTKAATKPGVQNDFYWRGVMTHFCIREWKARVAALAEFEVSCPFWWDDGHTNVAHSQGTFWWARASWIRKLSGFDWYYGDPWHNWRNSSDPEYEKRYACEFWISSNNLRGDDRKVESCLQHALTAGVADCHYPKRSRILAIRSL